MIMNVGTTIIGRVAVLIAVPASVALSCAASVATKLVAVAFAAT